ncbi:MAG TPA: NUDIX domain-containing protein [Baekduia sp.]
MSDGGDATDVVTKVGLALVRDGRLLLVRRHGDRALILPGGKPLAGETDVEALARELWEELCCRLVPSSLRYLGEFIDELVDDPRRQVLIRLYAGKVAGTLSPASEIREAVWHPVADLSETTLAPSLRHQILPSLARTPTARPS